MEIKENIKSFTNNVRSVPKLSPQNSSLMTTFIATVEYSKSLVLHRTTEKNANKFRQHHHTGIITFFLLLFFYYTITTSTE